MLSVRSRAALAIVFTCILASCASDPALTEDPAFVAGFGDGCVTAREQDKSFSTTRERDEHLFESSRAYRAGWRQGNQECQDPASRINDGGRILGNEPEF
ncbi:MAG: hypothetical protein R3C51_00940 [Parvularculaceae bacterium]